MKEIWAEFVHRWRRERKVNQTELGRHCGWSDTRISDFERTAALAEMPSLAILVKALAIPAEAVLELLHDLAEVVRPDLASMVSKGKVRKVAEVGDLLQGHIAEPRFQYGEPEGRTEGRVGFTDDIARLTVETQRLTWAELDRRIEAGISRVIERRERGGGDG